LKNSGEHIFLTDLIDRSSQDDGKTMNITEAQHELALYIDLEWNCWDGPPIPGRYQEIIEIGIVEMNLATLETTREKDYLIRPRHLDISAACTQITGLTEEDLKSASPFPEVIEQFATHFSPRERLCCTWGSDAHVLASACSRYKIPCPVRNRLDVSQLFWHCFLLRQQPSLRTAIEIAELPFDRIAHTALGDARNTARVHAEIIRRMRRQPSPVPTQPIPADVAPQPSILAEKLRRFLNH
jgi:inhibitor of KinA sporulation pathway (predicted exonuclease)